MKKTRKISMIPEFLKNRKTYMLTALVFTIIGILSLSFAFFRAQTTNQPTNSTVMVETVDIAGSIQKFTVYYDNNDGFFETGLLNISSTYTDIMKFRVVSGYSLGSQNISINWKSVKSGLTKTNSSYNLYSCTSSNYSSATIANVTSLCTKISLTSGNYLPATDEKTRLTSASDINLAANETNYYIATISIPAIETGKGFDGAIAVKHNIDYILTLDLNGGTLDSTTGMTLGTGDTITLPGPTKTGQMVSNWTTVCTECQVIGMQFTMGISDATITAQWVTDTYNYEYNGTTGDDGSYQTFTAPQTGTYDVQAWGAQGGGYTSKYIGGYGSYTKGEIYLTKGEKLYVYVGGTGIGNNAAALGGYNGGGSTVGGSWSSSGGGATDIRCFIDESTGKCTTNIENLSWNDSLGLNSRIMVAAGGGGSTYYDSVNKHGGGLFNESKTSSQTYGYSLGVGGDSPSTSAAGGGGYYGGNNGIGTYGISNGGTSYISGHIGCNSIISSESRIYNGSALHFSNKYFINTIMIDGAGYSWTNIRDGKQAIPNPNGGNYSSNTGHVGNGKIILKFINYLIKDTNLIAEEKLEILKENNYSLSNNYQLFTVPQTGTYKFESWGAQGGGYANRYAGGYGSYTNGYIYLTKGEKLYVYVGGEGIGNNATSVGGYNGGGNTVGGSWSSSGGGASDIRCFINAETGKCSINTTNLSWNDSLGLNSRIMVAAGGGGSTYNDSVNKHGGGLFNESKTSSQTYGYSFGKGGDSPSTSAAGGGGYYGGSNGNGTYGISNGGTSYISGHIGCNSMISSESRIYNGSALHFSNKYFINTIMIDGAGYNWSNIKNTYNNMPNPYNTNNALRIGNSGHGYVRITMINNDIKTQEVINSEKSTILREFNYSLTNNYQQFIVPESGDYIFESWGAQGGEGVGSSGRFLGGYGAYTSGEIYLLKNEILYIYVGGAGGTGLIAGGYNGGGESTAGGVYSSSGGGASDIRCFIDRETGKCSSNTTNLSWNDSIGLNSRIMVASGGGGSTYNDTIKKHAGGLLNDSNTSSQTFGYSFGSGEKSLERDAASGGGYYGGTSVSRGGYGQSNGGTSYISGHTGCIAINNLLNITNPRTFNTSCSSNITKNCSYHLGLQARTSLSEENRYFTNTLMIDGRGYSWTTEKSLTTSTMSSPYGGYNQNGVGNTGNGYVRIMLQL